MQAMLVDLADIRDAASRVGIVIGGAETPL